MEQTDETFLLDLLNSTPIIDGVQQDELDRAWLRAHGHSGSTAEWQATRAARSALQAVVRGHQSAKSLSRQLDQVSYRPSVSEEGVQWRLDSPTGRTAAAQLVPGEHRAHRSGPARWGVQAPPHAFVGDRRTVADLVELASQRPGGLVPAHDCLQCRARGPSRLPLGARAAVTVRT